MLKGSQNLNFAIAADDFDQRHQMGRIERMSDDAALRMFATGLNATHQESRRARCNERCVGSNRIQEFEEIDLRGFVFRTALLHETHVPHRASRIGNDPQAFERRAQHPRAQPRAARAVGEIDRNGLRVSGALVGRDEAGQLVNIKRAIGMGDKGPGQAEHARIPLEGPGGEFRQLPVIAGRQVRADFADVLAYAA